MKSFLLGSVHCLKVALYNLRHSISSVNYYKDVYNLYKGYGLKYIFLISWLSAMIYGANILWGINKIQEAILSQDGYVIDNIVKQIPTVNYDGSSIDLSAKQPVYIYDGAGNKIAAIDTEGALQADERKLIPVVFRKNNIAVNFTDGLVDNQENLVIEYGRVFGKKNQTITGRYAKDIIVKSVDNFGRLFIYLGMPLLGIGRFIEVILKKGFSILVTMFIGYTLGLTMNFKKSCRLVMFASATSVLLQPLVMLVPMVGSVLFSLLQIVPGALVVMALIRISGRKTPFSK